MQLAVGLFDLIVLLSSIVIVIWIGLRASAKTDSVEAFLLGDRDLPWWAILGSIVATETSTATVLSLPALAYGPVGMKFLQLGFGFIIGRTIVVYCLLPLYFGGKLFSAYEVLKLRFGSSVQRAASLLFLVTRNIGDGLRLFLAAVVIWKLLGWSLIWSSIAIGGITIFYTYFGGMRSIVWNDCIQLVIYLLGGLVTVFVIAASIPGGWEEFWTFVRETGKSTVFQLAPPDGNAAGKGLGEMSYWVWLVSDPYSLWAGLLGGAVLTLGTHGTDQMMVQRYLSARSQRDAGWAIFLSGIVVLLQFLLFLFIGVQLGCYYAGNPEIVFEKSDEIYAHFIVNSFPKNTGLVGLMLAAILAAAMSTLSSSLNASASALINDFYLPLRKTPPSARNELRLTRILAAGFGILQVGIGIWASTFDDTVISNALTIAGFSAGILLGLFALGTLSSRVGQAAALGGAAVGLLVLLAAQFGVPVWTGQMWPGAGFKIAWPWFALIGAFTTFVFGYSFSWVVPRVRPESNLVSESIRKG